MVTKFKIFESKINEELRLRRGGNTLMGFIGRKIKINVDENFTFDFMRTTSNYEPFDYTIEKEIRINPTYHIWHIGNDRILTFYIDLTDYNDSREEIDPYGEENWDNKEIKLGINISNAISEDSPNGISFYLIDENKPKYLNFRIELEDDIKLIKDLFKSAYKQESMFNNRLKIFKDKIKNL